MRRGTGEHDNGKNLKRAAGTAAGNGSGEVRAIRLTIAFGLLLLLMFAGLGTRCFFVGYLRADQYGVVLQHHSRVAQTGCRGTIFDIKGRVLAASNIVDTVFADPALIVDVAEVAQKLAPILEMDVEEIGRRIRTGRSSRYRRIGTLSDAEKVQQVTAMRLKGIGVHSGWQRYYPAEHVAAHAVGFTNIDGDGLGGVEFQYQEELKAGTEERVYLADVQRRPVRLVESSSSGRDGVSLILTIDAVIQEIARKELVEQCKSYEAESGIALVMNPQTGAILAMVSWPDYDSNRPGEFDADSLRNRMLTDPYEPGSILKPVVMAIAMDEGVINKNTVIFCEDGSYRGRGFGSIKEYNNKRYGNMTVKEIQVESSNIGMAKIGQMMTPGQLYNGLRRFGFGGRSGIDLPGEGSGILWPTSRWTGYSVTRIPFGQEISVTAIQMARAFCILANGGRPVTPHVVHAWVERDPQGRPVVARLNEAAERSPGLIIRPEMAQWMVGDALAAVVEVGTGKPAASKKWKVWGKTGTANIARSDGPGYEDDAYIASFVGGAPVEEPRVVAMVSIRRPNTKLGQGYSGGRVASPVAGKIIEQTMDYLESQ